MSFCSPHETELATGKAIFKKLQAGYNRNDGGAGRRFQQVPAAIPAHEKDGEMQAGKDHDDEFMRWAGLSYRRKG